VCVCVCVCARARARVRVCVCACVRARACVRACVYISVFTDFNFLQFQEKKFYLYALYNKNKPKSDSLMSEYGTSFFKVKNDDVLKCTICVIL